MRSAIAVIAIWLGSASGSLAQNCVIEGTTNYGTITQTCIVTPPPPAKLAFEAAVAEELVRKIHPGTKIKLVSIGSASDQEVATKYALFLQNRGLQVIERTGIGTVSPPPDHPISIHDAGSDVVIVTIAPSAR